MSDKDEINVKTITPATEEVMLPPVKSGGWMMFYKYPNSGHWMYGMPNFDPVGARDTIRFPHPLFMSREEAMDEARKRLSYGGDVKLFKVDL